MSPLIRLAGAPDTALLAQLHAAAFAPPDVWDQAAIGAMLGLPGGFGLIANAQGFVLARSVADEAELLTLAVHPAARRQGLGAALLAAAGAVAARRGAVALFLEVSTGNSAAQALYAAAGARLAGRRGGYYPDGADALVLRVPLTPCAAKDA